jgi:hypothetical protein
VEDIRFDDLDQLKSKISDQFGGWSEPVEITQAMINQFAELTGDHQWIHVDVERAKRESPFKGPIAHGFLTLSMLPATRPTTARTSCASSRRFPRAQRSIRTRDSSAPSRIRRAPR